MTHGSKQKGKRFERELTKDLSINGGKWKRIPGSGSIGTTLGMSNLTGDNRGSYPWWHKELKGEAKFGYGSSKQMQLKREWFSKVREEAAVDNKYPVVLLKFTDVTQGDLGSAKVICFNFDVWNEMMAELEELYNEYLLLLEGRFIEERSNE